MPKTKTPAARRPLQTAVDEKKLNAHPPTRAELEAIGDPLERFTRAAELARKCRFDSKEMMILRHQRVMVAVALFRWHEWKIEEVIRFIKAKDRRYIDEDIDRIDLNDIPDEYQDLEVAKQAALNLQKEFEDSKLIATTAREFRRSLSVGLTTGKFYDGERIMSKHLAKIAGVSDASIAQGRTGSATKRKRSPRKAKTSATAAAKR